MYYSEVIVDKSRIISPHDPCLFSKSEYNGLHMNIGQGITQFITILQIIFSILLIASILIQRSEAGVGGTFGGSDGFSSAHHQKRGVEKFVFIATIILAILFAVSSLGLLILN